MAENGDDRMCGTMLVLASASPRRRELLSTLGVSFTTAAVEVGEWPLLGESPWWTARRLAVAKARAATGWQGETVILAADTVVDLDGKALGKPRDSDEARLMLRRLRSRIHLVHTGLAIRSAGMLTVAVVTTRVEMRPYSDEEIERYVVSGAPFDKAGAYAIQDQEFRPVERLAGSYSNVVGLPLHAAARLLRGAGIPLRDQAPDTCEREGE